MFMTMYRVAEIFCNAEIVAIRGRTPARKNFKFLLTKLRKLSPLPLTAGPITPQGVDPPLQRFNLEEIARSQG